MIIMKNNNAFHILAYGASVALIIAMLGLAYYLAYSLPSSRQAAQEEQAQQEQQRASIRGRAQDALTACNNSVVQYFATRGAYDINSTAGFQKYGSLIAACTANNPIP